MKIANFVFIITFTILFCNSLSAQNKNVLTLEKSVNIALENNPQIKIAEKELQKAESAVIEAYGIIMPQLDATATFQHAWEIQESTIPNFIKTMLGPAATPDMPDFVKISFGLENTFNYGAQISQPIFLGFAGIAAIKTAQAAKKAAAQNLDQTRQSLIFNTANAFYSCLLARELVRVQEEALQQSSVNLQMVQKKYNVGMASGFDKMRAEVEYANLQPGLISAKNNYQSALTALRTVLGLPKETEIEVKGVFEFTEGDLSKMSLTEVQEIAVKNRPELKALDQQKIMMKQNITVARSNFLPKLYFMTDYSFMGMRNDLKFSQKDFSKGFTSMLTLQIPLFRGFRSAKQYHKAKLDYKITVDTEKQLYDGIAAEVEVSYNKLQEAKEKYFSAVETVDLAAEALRLANLMYDEGANTQLDVLNSQLALTRANLNSVSSLYEYQVARYELSKVTGQLNEIL